MALINDVIDILKDAYATSLQGLTATSTIATIGRYIAGIGGMFYIGKSVMGQISRNESINFIPLIRPIFFLMAVGWSGSICDSIDGICDSISISAQYDSEGMKKAYENYDNQVETAIAKKWENIAKDKAAFEKEFGEGSYSETFGTQWTNNVVIGISKMKDDFIAAILDTTTEVLQWVNYFAFMVMYLMSFLFRICLRAVAPIAIGIAIFDGFSNNAVEWLGKYINYALLPAIANLYGALSFNILTKMMKALIDNGIIGNENAKIDSFDITTFGAAYIAVLIVLIIGWFFIPTIANMVVSVGGSSAAIQGFAGRAAALGAGVAAGAKMAGRGAVMSGGAVQGAFQGAKDGFNKSQSGWQSSGMSGQMTAGQMAGNAAGSMGSMLFGGAKGAVKGAGDANVATKRFKRNMSYRYGSGQYGSR